MLETNLFPLSSPEPGGAKSKILLLGQGPGIGGAERAVFSAFRTAPDDMEFVVAVPDAQAAYATALGYRVMRLELPRIRTPFVGALRFISQSLRVARLARSIDADLIYASAIRAMGYALGARLFGGPPILAHDHHLLAAGDPHHLSGGLANRRMFIRALEWKADSIIVPSKAAAAAFRPSAKVHLIPYGIDCEHFVPASDTEKTRVRHMLGVPPDTLVVGTVTRADPEKGMESFLEACVPIHRSQPDAYFLMVGGATFPHERTHYDRIIGKARDLLGDRIVLTGRVEDPLPAFQAMDVMLHTSDPESFGLTVIEAMACRVPVVAFGWGGVTEIISPGINGFLTSPKGSEEMAQSALSLLKDADLRREIGERGRDTVLTRYQLSRFIDDLTSTIRQLVR